MKKTFKKPKTKFMFAVVRLIADREDPKDSSAEIFKVYKTKKAADNGVIEARKEFLLDISNDIDEAEAILNSDCERHYDWSVKRVKVEI